MERSLAKVQRSCGRTMTLQGARKSCQSNERGAPLKSFEKCAHGPQGCILTRADVQTCPVLLSTSQAQPGRAFSQLSDLSFAPHCKLGRQEAEPTYAFFRQHALLQKIILSHLPSRMDMYMRVPTGNKYCSILGHTFWDCNQIH